MAAEGVHQEKRTRVSRVPLQIKVQKLSGDTKTIDFELDRVGVSVVKSRIAEEMGVAVSRQMLSKSTSVLGDSETLTESCQLDLIVVDLCEHITLVVGDPFDKDIGGEEIHIISNFRAKDVQTAYENGCEIVGFDLQKEFCAYNGEHTLPATACAKLHELGFDFSSLSDVEGVESATTEGLNLRRTSAWPELWLFVARLAAPDLHHEMERRSPHKIEIGGCGLYVE
eukprot:TRINITY_DN1232_c0_g1_i4.p1 TRINITY_DN1232_c0_g1~~TRINITY_DN1232_c0_g1_i4.p1  ORF type:complete len:246 (+),score=40.74 TRINITY_DN1232_c0_g1_i4:63-740(+)